MLPSTVVAEQEPFFITLAGPKARPSAHDSSVEKSSCNLQTLVGAAGASTLRAGPSHRVQVDTSFSYRDRMIYGRSRSKEGDYLAQTFWHNRCLSTHISAMRCTRSAGFRLHPVAPEDRSFCLGQQVMHGIPARRVTLHRRLPLSAQSRRFGLRGHMAKYERSICIALLNSDPAVSGRRLFSHRSSGGYQ